MSEKTAITEDDIWLLASAAENLRGGSQDPERRADAAFRIAYKLDELRKRLAAIVDANKDTSHDG